MCVCVCVCAYVLISQVVVRNVLQNRYVLIPKNLKRLLKNCLEVLKVTYERICLRAVTQLGSNLGMCVLKIFGHINWYQLRKNQYGCYITIDIDLSMKYKRDNIFFIKFEILWSLLPDSVVQFLTPLYQFFTKIIIRNAPW